MLFVKVLLKSREAPCSGFVVLHCNFQASGKSEIREVEDKVGIDGYKITECQGKLGLEFKFKLS